MATTSQQTENVDVVRQTPDTVTTRNLDAVDDLVTGDYVEHDPASPSDRRGPAALKAFVEPSLSAFPDFELVEADAVAAGDKVVYRHHATGTHEAALLGIPPTGERVHVDGIAIYRFEDGRTTEKWVVDSLGLLSQLGVAPELPRSSEGA